MKRVIYTIFILMTVLNVTAHTKVEFTPIIQKDSVLIFVPQFSGRMPTVSRVMYVKEPTSQDSKKRKRFLPTYRRMDRGINDMPFAYKGEFITGLTASYGTLSQDNTDFLLVISDISADGAITTIKPYVGYFYRNDRCIGVRLGYSHLSGSIDAANIDLGPSNDITAVIPYVGTRSDNYSFGIFHRSYAGLDPKGRFGLFAELELEGSFGTSEFTYETGGEKKTTFSDNTQFKLMFNPGVAVYIFPNVCSTLSFGLGGVKYTNIKQEDSAGNRVGSRTSSSMKFKLNLLAINIGMTVHLWDKKK